MAYAVSYCNNTKGSVMKYIIIKMKCITTKFEPYSGRKFGKATKKKCQTPMNRICQTSLLSFEVVHHRILYYVFSIIVEALSSTRFCIPSS